MSISPESSTAMDDSAASLASGSQSNEQESPPAPAPPPRVYDTYSWSTKSPTARVVYLQNEEATNLAILQLNSKCLGFDLEWKPNFVKGRTRNPVALVQLASPDLILLIHIFHMNTFPERLRELLADETVVKAGVGIQEDCKKLYSDYGVDTRNCVDLSLLARTVDNARWKGKYATPIGLARLCETYEELTLQKGRVQTSNWELPLDARQQDYAANDGHAGLTLYMRLAAMAAAMSPIPQPLWYSFDTINGMLYQPSSGVVWHPYNPYYDPGPLPPPRPPRAADVIGPDGAVQIPNRANRYSRRNRPRFEQPGSLSPSASAFVPGARTHTASPSPTPGSRFTPASPPSTHTHNYTHVPPSRYPIASGAPPAVPRMDIDMDGFPRPVHSPRAYQSKPKAFIGGGSGGFGAHPGTSSGVRGRGRGRGRGRDPTVQLGFFSISG